VLEAAAEDPAKTGRHPGTHRTRRMAEAGAGGQPRVDRELRQHRRGGTQPVHDRLDPAVSTAGRQHRARPAGHERGGERDDRHRLGPDRELGKPHRGDQPEAQRDPVQRAGREPAPGRPAGHVPCGWVDKQPRHGALAVGPGVEHPDRNPAAGELAEQRAKRVGRAGRRAGRDRFGRACQRVEVSRVHDKRTAR
jgi:hypothetical protein